MNEEQFRKFASQILNTPADELQVQVVGSTGAFYGKSPTSGEGVIIDRDMQSMSVGNGFPSEKLVEAYQNFKREQEATGQWQH